MYRVLNSTQIIYNLFLSFTLSPVFFPLPLLLSLIVPLSSSRSDSSSSSSSTSTTSSSSSFVDTLSSHFLAGNISVSVALLKLVDFSILEHLFLYLVSICVYLFLINIIYFSQGEGEDTRAVRLVLLELLIEKCKNAKVLDSIGGVGFFQRILQARDSHIAQYVFLITQVYVRY